MSEDLEKRVRVQLLKGKAFGLNCGCVAVPDVEAMADALSALREKLVAVEGERDDLAQRAAVIDEVLTNAIQLRAAAEAREAKLTEALTEAEGPGRVA